MTVPYHADVIGSLLRPRYLSEARAALAAGRISHEEFKRIEDRDTERTLTEGVDIINSVADVPGVTFGLHICKGNNKSTWIATGGYEFTADKVFGRSGNFDVFLLEYDDERSGSFEPLASVPDDKVVVLGLVSSKLSEMESPDKVIARIDEAARYVDRERLALSTQCGFSPVSIGGNLISEDTQQHKLELVAEVAHQVW